MTTSTEDQDGNKPLAEFAHGKPMSGSTPIILLDWQLAILGSNLPPTTRHVLLTLSVRMKWKNLTCFPSVDTLEKETGLARSTICQHLTEAENARLLIIEKRSGTGQKWRRNLYRACIPHDGESGRAVGSPVEPADQAKAVRQPTEGGSPGAEKVVRQSVSNYPFNESLNSAGVGARPPARNIPNLFFTLPIDREEVGPMQPARHRSSLKQIQKNYRGGGGLLHQGHDR